MSSPPDFTLPELRQFLQKGNLFLRYKGYTGCDDFFKKGDGSELAASLHDGKVGEVLQAATPNQQNLKQQFEFELVDGILTGKIFVRPDGGKKVAISVNEDGTLCACECDKGTLFSVGWNGKGHVISTAKGGKELYWTLVNESDGAQIQVMEWKGNHQQAWGFVSNHGN
ncbi:hypothetical protein H1R20_g7407, partial [Candolleomyces eurysporus]